VVFKLTEHAKERAIERGTTQEEIQKVLSKGKKVQVKEGRRGKEMVFEYRKDWLGKPYPQKKVKVIYIEEEDEVVVITVKVYYGKWR
jgi:hypothetical protein